MNYIQFMDSVDWLVVVYARKTFINVQDLDILDKFSLTSEAKIRVRDQQSNNKLSTLVVNNITLDSLLAEEG